MPCEDCGHLLCVDTDERTSLFCPRCQGLAVESQAIIDATTNWLLEDHFTDENIIGLLQSYSKSNLLYYLITRLNRFSNDFTNDPEQGIPISEFGYLTYIIKQVYQTNGFGEEPLHKSQEIDEEIEVIREAYTSLIVAFQGAQDKFSICVKRDGYTGRMEDFTSNYELLQSEYGLCFERCTKSIVCGDFDQYDDYSYVADVLRAVDKTDVSEVDTPQDFADAWYQFLLQLRLIASSDEMVGDVYYTQLPEDITIFDIEEFLDRLDSLFSDEVRARMVQESLVPPLDPDTVGQCGQQAFGDSWDEVRNQVIVSDENLDAHPFLFELDVIEERRFRGSRRPRQVPTTKLFYPREFSRLMKFQIYPMLENGDYDTSHKLLSNLTGDRGDVYERNLYNFLTENGIECYHSAEITRNNPNEIDLLCIFEERVVFIEVKYLLPPIRINGPEGIRVLNEKFNRLIFNEVNDESNREAEGKTFSEKVEAWMDLDPGDSFRWQVDPTQSNREETVIPNRWNDLEVKKYVVSNVVPSYVVKGGVRFLTDLELYQLIEHKDTDVLYSLP